MKQYIKGNIFLFTLLLLAQIYWVFPSLVEASQACQRCSIRYGCSLATFQTNDPVPNNDPKQCPVSAQPIAGTVGYSTDYSCPRTTDPDGDNYRCTAPPLPTPVPPTPYPPPPTPKADPTAVYVPPQVRISATPVPYNPPPVPACPSVFSPTLGAIDLPVRLTTGGMYVVWIRMKVQGDSANSIYFKPPGQNDCAVTVGDKNGMSTNWEWVNYKDGNTGSLITAQFPSGDSRIVLSGREAGVRVNKVLLLNNNCVPTGDGSNCTGVSTSKPTPVPYIPPPTPKADPTAVYVPPQVRISATPVPYNPPPTPVYVPPQVRISATPVPYNPPPTPVYVPPQVRISATPVPYNPPPVSKGTPSKITVYAYGTDAGGVYPTMQLLIDNQVVIEWKDVGLIVPFFGSRVKKYEYIAERKIQAFQVKVQFVNDAVINGQDRNLFIDRISIDGVDYQSEAANVFTTSCKWGFNKTEWLYCSGYFAY